jgi:hypothetical protein
MRLLAVSDQRRYPSCAIGYLPVQGIFRNPEEVIWRAGMLAVPRPVAFDCQRPRDEGLERRVLESQMQWRRLGGQAARGPAQFQFTSGEVMLNLAVGFWILSLNEPDLEDDLSIQIFALIYEHELLHFLEEIEIMSWLPPRLLNETAPNPTARRGRRSGGTSPRLACGK